MLFLLRKESSANCGSSLERSPHGERLSVAVAVVDAGHCKCGAIENAFSCESNNVCKDPAGAIVDIVVRVQLNWGVGHINYAPCPTNF